MSADLYARPSGYARWGWGFTALQAALVLFDLVGIVWGDGGWPNVAAAVFCALMGVYCWRLWRRSVREDAAHRAFMRASYERWTR